MTLRVARHTTDFAAIQTFYVELLGLEVLGEFKGHNQYDGLFLGKPDLAWHLEFTVSNHQPAHQPDEDDLLVFYLHSPAEYEQVRNRFAAAGVREEEPRNPYWNRNAVTYSDPDGFRVVISVRKDERS